MGQQTVAQADTLAGRVAAVEPVNKTFTLQTRSGDVQVGWSAATSAERLRNLGESYQDCSTTIIDQFQLGAYLFVRALFYAESGPPQWDATHLIFCGQPSAIADSPGWWPDQLRALAKFLLRSEFPAGSLDFRSYSTYLSRSGRKRPRALQDANSLSRFIYAMAAGFMLTGEESLLQAAELGADYLRNNFRLPTDPEHALWFHALDVRTSPPTCVLGSPLPGDGGAITAFDEIYVLSGPAQLYRVNGDPALRTDVERTVRMFDRYFRDPQHGGFFSHLDPVSLDPRSAALGDNRARKNWNSIGDHAPAYLFNLWLATGEERWAGRLEEVFDLVVRHCPDFEHSPLVLERFHEDWTPDTTWGWQQDRGIVGHNLKIAWNLVRAGLLLPRPGYRELAERIAAVLPGIGLDQQRGGWFDVVERHRRPGEPFHRFVWHNRKYWWQQEQAILAFLLLAGVHDDSASLRLARESIAFYNAFFLDHDDGEIFIDVEANGSPVLRGEERFKCNHYKAGYHSSELAFLATVYHELLIARRPLLLHFRPHPQGFPDGRLRVAPDLLPGGSVRVDRVWVDGRPWNDFGPDLTVALPRVTTRPMIQVRLVPHDR
jgi:mannose/cellobiose epimerase-like protein (N-acyl-D-glucosamine 2-epimerase family)